MGVMEPIEMFNFSAIFQIFNFSIFFVIRETNCPIFYPTKKIKWGNFGHTKYFIFEKFFAQKFFSELVKYVSNDLLPDMSVT